MTIRTKFSFIFSLLFFLSITFSYSQTIKKTYYDYKNTKVFEVFQVNNKSIKHGYYKKYFEDGALWIEGNYSNGLVNGVWKEYDSRPNHKLASTSEYKENALNGTTKMWSGKDPSWKETYISDIYTYENNVIIEVKEFDENGKPKKIDTKNGECKIWYSNGNLMSRWINSNGTKVDSTYVEFMENGKPKIQKIGSKTYKYSDNSVLIECSYDSIEYRIIDLYVNNGKTISERYMYNPINRNGLYISFTYSRNYSDTVIYYEEEKITNIIAEWNGYKISKDYPKKRVTYYEDSINSIEIILEFFEYYKEKRTEFYRNKNKKLEFYYNKRNNEYYNDFIVYNENGAKILQYNFFEKVLTKYDNNNLQETIRLEPYEFLELAKKTSP
jgi:hypothetical protein